MIKAQSVVSKACNIVSKQLGFGCVITPYEVNPCAANPEDLNSLQVLLDICSGVDAVMMRGKHIYGVSLRTQFGAKSYETFTIRRERFATAQGDELKKMIERRRDNDCLRSSYVLQSYFHDDGRFINAALARIDDVLSAALTTSFYRESAEARFLCVPWCAVHNITIVRGE
jgi:hypothetical protein